MTPWIAPVGAFFEFVNAGRAWKARNKYDEPSTRTSRFLSPVRADLFTALLYPVLNRVACGRKSVHALFREKSRPLLPKALLSKDFFEPRTDANMLCYRKP